MRRVRPCSVPLLARFHLAPLLTGLGVLLYLCASVGGGAAATARAAQQPRNPDFSRPQLMPPHPDLLAWIQAQGYDSVTFLNLQRLEAWKEFQGIDQPEPITAPVAGTRPAIVLLVEFSDLAHNVVSTPASYNSMLFSVGTYAAPGSMRDYYNKVSYNTFDITPNAVDSWRQAISVHTVYANNNGIGGEGPGSDDYGLGP